MTRTREWWFVQGIGIVVGLTGFAILLFSDWRIAVGLALAMFGNNVTQATK